MHAVDWAERYVSANPGKTGKPRVGRRWDTTKVPGELVQVKLLNGRLLKNFHGAQNWVRGRLSPDVGMFEEGCAETELSCSVRLMTRGA